MTQENKTATTNAQLTLLELEKKPVDEIFYNTLTNELYVQLSERKRAEVQQWLNSKSQWGGKAG